VVRAWVTGLERKRCNESDPPAFDAKRNLEDAIMKSFVIGALAVAVAVLGYLYWDSQHNTIFKAPGVEIKKNQ
jgi:hypothetical protein